MIREYELADFDPLPAPVPEAPPKREPGDFRLVDCFLEVFTYTAYFLQALPVQEPPFEDVSRAFLALLTRASALRDRTEATPEEWEQALFAVCAWVDETLLCSTWSGRDQWFSVQLQRVRFNTTRAGERFFSQLKELPEDAIQVREVYDHCLALGFKGLHYDPAEAPALREIQEANLACLVKSEDLRVPPDLFPEAGRALGPAVLRPALRVHYLLLALWIALPVAVFLGLYTFFDSILGRMAVFLQ
jgi:type VI secretion system protein ImpK